MHYFEEPTDDNPIYPCGICNRIIAKNHRYIRCNICNFKVHIKCNETDDKTYAKMKTNDETMFCIKCNEDIMPFFPTLSGKRNYSDLSTSSSVKSFFKGLNELNNNQIDDSNDTSPPINCKYEDISSFKHKSNKNEFSLFHLNIASLSKHKHELETILTMLEHKFDIIGISETKLIKNIVPNYDTSLEGYTTYETPTEGDKGGVSLYIAKYYKCKPRQELDSLIYNSCELESKFIEIIHPNKKNTVVGCIYRHPLMDLNQFNENYLNPLMVKLSSENKNIFLMGDFNIDLLKTDIDINISNFFDNLTANLMVPHIIYPTRITPTSKTLIDNIFSNSINFLQGYSGNLTLSISDHLAQFLIIPVGSKFIPKKVNLFKRDTKNYDREKFNVDLNNIDWPTVLNLDDNNPNDSFNSFEASINVLVNKYMPLKKLTKKEISLQYKPWITYGIRKSIERREKLFKKFIKAKDEIVKDEYHKKYKELRNKIITLCRQGKTMYYQAFFTENANSAKNTWKGIKSIININSTSKTEPTSILVNDKIITDPIEVANSFNNYFSSIAEDLQGKIYQGNDFTKYLGNNNDHSFFIKPTDKFEVLNIINDISINKATGPHSIPTNILHQIKHNISEPLSNVINLSFQNGVFPENLKTAKTIPIFKDKGSNLECSNYRPISLLSNINKIFEKLMHSRLYNFLSIHNCIYDLQFGFRSKHSTNHALLDLTEDIRRALDDNSFAVGIFIDLQKAFDTVDHNILLHKLDHYGIRGLANDWLRSYLTDRKQYVSINGFKSNTNIMKFGVPQGSVLGPLLFLIYINDLHKAIKYCTTRHFADDTNILIKNKSLKQLKKHVNFDLRNLCKWLKSNKISLNASKTELLVFRHPNKEVNYNLKIKIDGKRLLPSNYVKYLGLYIDSHLKWNYHTDILAPKLSRALGMLTKIRHYVSKITLRTIYFGIFSSILTYGCQIWGQILNKNVNRIIKLQDKVIRVINFSHYNASRNLLYNDSKILKLTDNIKLLNFIYVHNSLNGTLPSALNNNFVFSQNSHTYITRGSLLNKILLPKVRTKIYGLKSINYESSIAWNNLVNKFGEIILHVKTKSYCKKLITQHLLDNYLN